MFIYYDTERDNIRNTQISTPKEK